MLLDKLINTGVYTYCNDNTLAQKQKTLIVLGVARGGTSAIAGTLDKLGVFTGERSKEPVFEDLVLAEAIEKNNTKKIKNIIAKYNESHNVWAFKRPSLINSIAKYHSLFRNPVYLIVFKDIFSIANRNNLSMQQNILTGLERALNDYTKILNFLKKRNPDYIMFSYEKIVQDKESFVKILSKVIGNNSQSQIYNAQNFIEVNPTTYLDVSRNTKSIGRIEVCNSTTVSGWGKYLFSDKPAEVELHINETCVKTMLANLKHSVKGEYGFFFDLTDLNLKKEDKIAVKLKEDILYLNGSQSEKTNQKLHKQIWFTQHQLNSMLSNQYQKPDFLRDIAVILRDKNDMENAYRLISKALELRPQGPVIQKLEKEIKELLFL
jgi:tetratricopeptide (TPR) repeat protein